MGFFRGLARRLLGRTQRSVSVSVAPIRGGYDAAQSGGMNSQHWTAAAVDALDADSCNSKTVRQKLTRQARYEANNNGHAKGVQLTQANYVVGRGPKLRVQTASKETNDRIEAAWKSWSKAMRLSRKLRTAIKAKITDGEAFLIARQNPALPDRIKLDLAAVEAEQVSTPYLGATATNQIDGIDFDAHGNPAYYQILKQHPGASLFMTANDAERVPSRFVFHLFREDRPGQHRAVPEITPTLNLFAVGRRFREATVVSAENIANFSLFLKTQGTANTEPDEVRPFSSLPIEKGMMTALPFGHEAFQPKPEQPTATYDTFTRAIMCEQARPLNMPYNIAAADSSGYSFSGGRLDHLTYFVSVDVEQEEAESEILDRAFALWWEEALLAYGWVGDAAEPPPHTWDWPARPQIDDQKTASARQTNLKTGVVSLRRLYAEDGLDFEEELAAMAADYGVTPERMRAILLDVNVQSGATTPVIDTDQENLDDATEDQPQPEDAAADMPAAPDAAAPPAKRIPGGTPKKPAPEVSTVTTKRSALLEMAGGITGILDILRALAAGEIARETAVALIALFYQITTQEASAIVGKSGQQEPTKPEPQPRAEPKPNGKAAQAAAN